MCGIVLPPETHADSQRSPLLFGQQFTGRNLLGQFLGERDMSGCEPSKGSLPIFVGFVVVFVAVIDLTCVIHV